MPHKNRCVTRRSRRAKRLVHQNLAEQNLIDEFENIPYGSRSSNRIKAIEQNTYDLYDEESSRDTINSSNKSLHLNTKQRGRPRASSGPPLDVSDCNDCQPLIRRHPINTEKKILTRSTCDNLRSHVRRHVEHFQAESKQSNKRRRVLIEDHSDDNEATLNKTSAIIKTNSPRPKRRLTSHEQETDDDVKQRRYPRRAHHLDGKQKSPNITVFMSPARRIGTRQKPNVRICQRERRRKGSTSTDTTGDESERKDERSFQRRAAKSMNKARQRFLPLNIDDKEAMKGVLGERTRAANLPGGASCADIDPMSIDRSTTFDSVGGLNRHIHALKEMVLFPLLYPNFFSKFSMTPPRGVIFYGPPGTGKTLIARALANECSSADRRVAFFMRKGADCLSKWVGESERQLRVLFDQAYIMRPSIIFFDEIDGLAPVRSTRQDQIHSSIVSTLLALMDGLDSRDEIVVIGATNRLDAIDPALRRPGRFDREFRFALPDHRSRRQILDIHTRKWQPKAPNVQILDKIAEQTQGCCGADLRAICNEAALLALRRTYPQIYESKLKLAIDNDRIKVKEIDFQRALRHVQPASHRNLTATNIRPLHDRVSPLLKETLDLIIAQMIPKAFQPEFSANAVSLTSFVENELMTASRGGGARLLIVGKSAHCGQTSHIAPAILNYIDHLPVHSLAIANIYAVSTHRSVEEAIAEILSSATAAGGYGNQYQPVVLYIQAIDQWYAVVPPSAWHTLQATLDGLDGHKPLLVLATAHCSYDDLNDDIKYLFGRADTYELPYLRKKEIKDYFDKIIRAPALFKPFKKEPKISDVPLASDAQEPLRKMSEREKKLLRRQEKVMVRQLRIFLRETTNKLIRDRRFQVFACPVNEEEVPDYSEVINNPMDLSIMMDKLDLHIYTSSQKWLDDIELICENCFEYNHTRNQSGRRLRHLACLLRDTAHALIEQELDDAFEEKLLKMRQMREEHGDQELDDKPPGYIAEEHKMTPKKRLDFQSDERSPKNQSKISLLNTPQRKVNLTTNLPARNLDAAKSIKKKYIKQQKQRNKSLISADCIDKQLQCSETHRLSNGTDLSPESKSDSCVDFNQQFKAPDINELHKCVDEAITVTQNWPFASIDRLGIELDTIVAAQLYEYDRSYLPDKLMKAIKSAYK